MSKLLGIVGSVSEPSKTQTAVEIAVQAAEKEFNIETEIVSLADYKIDTADSRKLIEYTGDTAKLLNKIIESDAFIIGTPAYRGSYSGVLKNLFDMIPRGKWQSDKAPLQNRPIGFIGTGATDHHYLLINQELGPIASFFGAYLVGGVYVNSFQYEGQLITDAKIIQRLETLGKAVAELNTFLDKSKFLNQLGPQF
ncbi:MAG: NAD(P)H-dependent oxidoreductase [Chitinophagales bacterium]|nr:NAD(P)H-dependent oxidoreductase [Chitinophagales bacterium]